MAPSGLRAAPLWSGRLGGVVPGWGRKPARHMHLCSARVSVSPHLLRLSPVTSGAPGVASSVADSALPRAVAHGLPDILFLMGVPPRASSALVDMDGPCVLFGCEHSWHPRCLVEGLLRKPGPVPCPSWVCVLSMAGLTGRAPSGQAGCTPDLCAPPPGLSFPPTSVSPGQH